MNRDRNSATGRIDLVNARLKISAAAGPAKKLAPSAVFDDQRNRDGRIRGRKARDILLDAVLKDGKILFL